MARVTVQEAVDKIGNRFDLVLTASRRARDLQLNVQAPLVPEDNDKPTVIALREIEEGLINQEIMQEQAKRDRLERERYESRASSLLSDIEF